MNPVQSVSEHPVVYLKLAGKLILVSLGGQAPHPRREATLFTVSGIVAGLLDPDIQSQKS